MELDVEENIELYLMIYHYAISLNFKNISNICVRGDLAIITHIEKVNNGIFEYNSLVTEHVYLTTESYQSFKRDYIIGTILYEPEIPTVYNNQNITYLRYKNMLSEYKSNFNHNLLIYIKSLKIGDPVYLGGSKSVINKFYLDEDKVDVYNLSDKKVHKVPMISVRPRVYKMKKTKNELVSDLLELSTRELLKLRKKMFHGNSPIGANYTYEDVVDVLNTREHLNMKRKSVWS